MSSSNKKYNLTGKVALVTGSSSGIGAAIAIELARNGALLTITGRNAEALASVAMKIKQVSASDREPLQLLGDLTDSTFVPKLIEQTVEQYGRLDFLVNNAGASCVGGHLTDDNLLQSFDELFSVNVRPMLKLTQLAVPHLEATKGNIVNISSIVGLRVVPLTPIAYQATKAALDMVTKCCAAELGPRGIRVNSVNPGPVVTGLGRSAGNANFFEDYADILRSMLVLNRIAEPEDIAHLVVFLLSDDAANITGSIMSCDAGMRIK